MATILRSSKYVRNFAEFANRLGSNYVKSDTRRQLISQRPCAPSTLARRSLATQAATQQTDNEFNLETSLRRLDSDVKKFGRISRGKLERVLTIFQNSKSVTSTQALMVIRCCGNLVPDELPESRSELVNQLWKSLEDSGIQLDLSHYNALLRVYVENEYAFSPAEVLAELERKGIEPNKLTYQRLINRYCQQGDIDGASKILEFMREKGISVNENIFTALVRGHSEANDMVSAADILTVMRQAGLEPSADTYKELLCGYAKHGDMESVTCTLSECQTNSVHLLDTDYLSVINSLARNGHSKHVETVLSIMPKEVGYLQDALNHVLKLVHAGHVDVAMQVLFSIPNRERGQTGTSVIKQLAKANLPAGKFLALCKEIVSKGINSRALVIGLESNLIQGNVEGSLDFIQALRESKEEIREHYFWPILIALGQSKDNAGIIDLLRNMQADCSLPVSGDTLRDYVMPYQTGEPDHILAEFLNVGIPTGTMACSIVYHLVVQNKLSAAVDFATKHTFRYNTSVFCRPLVLALAETKDVTSFVHILQHNYQNRFIGKSRDNQEVTPNEGIIEPYLNEVAARIREDNLETLARVLEGLLSVGVNITDAGAANLRRIIGDKTTPEVEKLINRFKVKQFGSGPSASFNLSASRSEILRLEQVLESSNSDEESVNATKTRLFALYSRVRDLPKLEQLLKEFTEQGIEVSVAMYKQLVDAYLNSDVLGKTDEYVAILRQRDPGYTLGDAKFIKYICLLVKDDRVDEAVQFLQDKQNIRPRDAEQAKLFWWRLLNNLADLGLPRAVDETFELLLQNEYIDISSSNLGPLIKVHIVRGDLKEAVSVFERICETYQLTPFKNELAKKLIAAEDATALQRLTDLSTQVHGELNSLYDLVASFIECDCLRQAKKILEIPALHSKIHRLQFTSKRYSEQGLTTFLERLVAVIKDVPYFKAVPQFYDDLLLCYVKEDNWEKGLTLYKEIEEEEIELSETFLTTLANLLKKHKQPLPFVAPNVNYDNVSKAEGPQRPRSGRSSSNRQRFSPRTTDAGADVDSKDLMPQTVPPRAKQESELIESLIKSGKMTAATEITESILEKNMYPFHRTFRYLIKKLGSAGEIELIKRIGKHLAVPMKKSVDFENSLCKAYIVSGKAEEYLDLLEKKLDADNKTDIDEVLAEFPMVGIRTLVQQHPELVERYTKMAVSQADRGLIHPINTLWIYYFVNELPEADKIWSDYLIKVPNVRFQSILHTAQMSERPDLVKRLIKTLNEGSLIDDYSKGFVYSELIKLCYLQGNYQESVDVLREALKVVSLKNLQPNTMDQMKSHLAAKGLALPADIFSESEETKDRQQITT